MISQGWHKAGMKAKTMNTKTILLTGLTTLSLLATTPALAALKTPAVSTQNGISSSSASASDAFPGLKGFLNLPAADRSQINIYYTARIKHADPSQVHMTLTDGSGNHTLMIRPDGRIEPLPTRDQLNNGAKVTISGPDTGSYAMRIHVYSTQPRGTTYDAAALVTGIKQGNSAMGKVAGPAAILLKKLDRVYFVGGGSATVQTGGQQQPLPRTSGDGEYPSGTPYFVPSDFQGATRISLSATPSIVLLDNSSK